MDTDLKNNEAMLNLLVQPLINNCIIKTEDYDQYGTYDYILVSSRMFREGSCIVRITMADYRENFSIAVARQVIEAIRDRKLTLETNSMDEADAAYEAAQAMRHGGSYEN